jgi:WhiB family redox-sensing transcriptional regulator
MVHVTFDEWVERAACTKAAPDLFFPELTSEERAGINRWGGFSFTERRAKTVCASCPVRRECLELMYSHGEQAGVWGGTLERERRKYRGLPEGERIAVMLADMDDQAERNGFVGEGSAA